MGLEMAKHEQTVDAIWVTQRVNPLCSPWTVTRQPTGRRI